MSEVRTSFIAGIVIGCTAAVVTASRAITNARKALADTHANINEFAQQSPDHARRQAVLEPFATALVRPEATPKLQAKIHDFLTAENDAVLTRVHDDLERLIHHEQVAIVRHVVAPRIADATAAAGFTNVRILPEPNSVLVIGDNDRGQALQHELAATPKRGLELRSETLGIRDGSCTAVLDEFTRELHNHGITLTTEHATSTLRQRHQQHHVVGRQR